MATKERFASCAFSDFSEVEELYRSQTGAVFKALFKYDSKEYILKERKLPELGKRKDIMNEVKLLLQLSHPNVIRCEGWFRDEVRCSLFIILEYCDGGDLYKLIQYRKASHAPFEERQIWYIFNQICQGLKHLHENGIVHRDLKALNIMLTKRGRVFKIGDLGVSRQVSEETVMLNTFYGTPLYLSPELVENKPYNEKTDMWSLGVLLYEMTTFSVPFKANTILALAKCVLKGKYEPISSSYSKHLESGISWLLQLDYNKRPNVMQVIEFVQGRVSPDYYGQGLGLLGVSDSLDNLHDMAPAAGIKSEFNKIESASAKPLASAVEDSMEEDSLSGKHNRSGGNRNNNRDDSGDSDSETVSGDDSDRTASEDELPAPRRGHNQPPPAVRPSTAANLTTRQAGRGYDHNEQQLQRGEPQRPQSTHGAVPPTKRPSVEPSTKRTENIERVPQFDPSVLPPALLQVKQRSHEALPQKQPNPGVITISADNRPRDRDLFSSKEQSQQQVPQPQPQQTKRERRPQLDIALSAALPPQGDYSEPPPAALQRPRTAGTRVKGVQYSTEHVIVDKQHNKVSGSPHHANHLIQPISSTQQDISLAQQPATAARLLHSYEESKRQPVLAPPTSPMHNTQRERKVTSFKETPERITDNRQYQHDVSDAAQPPPFPVPQQKQNKHHHSNHDKHNTTHSPERRDHSPTHSRDHSPADSPRQSRSQHRRKRHNSYRTHEHSSPSQSRSRSRSPSPRVSRSKPDVDIEVDIQRVNNMLRRETSQYRKLLQIRDFISAAPTDKGADNSEKASIFEKIADLQRNITALEKCVDSGGKIKHSLAKSLGLLTVKPEPQPDPSKDKQPPRQPRLPKHSEHSALDMYAQRDIQLADRASCYHNDMSPKNKIIAHQHGSNNKQLHYQSKPTASSDIITAPRPDPHINVPSKTGLFKVNVHIEPTVTADARHREDRPQSAAPANSEIPRPRTASRRKDSELTADIGKPPSHKNVAFNDQSPPQHTRKQIERADDGGSLNLPSMQQNRRPQSAMSRLINSEYASASACNKIVAPAAESENTGLKIGQLSDKHRSSSHRRVISDVTAQNEQKERNRLSSVSSAGSGGGGNRFNIITGN